MNNNVSTLAADSYFFQELTSAAQNPDQAFGPVLGNEQTQYRVTSKFAAVGDVKAFAICTGQVFIQPGADSSKLNLILRPYRQPIKGIAIKYFVYRGLKKTDFIPTGNTS